MSERHGMLARIVDSHLDLRNHVFLAVFVAEPILGLASYGIATLRAALDELEQDLAQAAPGRER